jgi:hypothetical protein
LAERAGALGGGGRKPTVEKDVTLLADLEALVEPTSRGDPESPLRWTCKSLRRLANELQAQGHQVSHTLVGELLENLDYSLQGNRKTKESLSHPDRDAQFSYINDKVVEALAAHESFAEEKNWAQGLWLGAGGQALYRFKSQRVSSGPRRFHVECEQFCAALCERFGDPRARLASQALHDWLGGDAWNYCLL